MKQSTINRRQLLYLGSVGVSVATLAACVSPSPFTTNASEPIIATSNLPTATAETVSLPTATVATALFNGIPHGITDEGFHYLGDPNAPVTMFDYSDFL